MASPSSQLSMKVTGYLDKKAKLRIGSLWKKYWFVLEGRLLLYYRSKDEYEGISPCKGSISLLPPCTIKPVAAVSSIFQIVGRATTVTIRAESRCEQERWMQALLTAIDQSKPSPTRLSHFRYSFDEIPVPYQEKEIPLQRHYSMPYNATPTQDITRRLQLISARPYGGSLNTFTKHSPLSSQTDIFNNKYNSKSSSNVHTSHRSKISMQSRNQSAEIISGNSDYSTIQEENSLDVLMNVRRYKALSLEEIKKIKDRSNLKHKENAQYLKLKETGETKEVQIRNKKLRKSESLYERISDASNKYSAIRLRRKNSNIHERILGLSNSSEKLNRLKLKDQYSIAKKFSSESLQLQNEPEYYNPEILEDHNKNSLIIENAQYLPGFDNPNDDDYYKIDPLKEQLEGLYEDPDLLYKTIEIKPALPPRPDTKKLECSTENSNNSSLEKTKTRKGRFHMLAQLIKSDKKVESDTGQTRPKKKRSRSFMHRILRRKEKPVETSDDVYTALQNTTDKLKNVNDLQMFEELQKILEERKEILKKKLNVSGTESVDNKESNTQTVTKDNEIATTETVHVITEERPSLPPRQNSQSSILHNNQSTNLTNTLDLVSQNVVNVLHTNTTNNQIKTLDEIIESLEKEKSIQDSKHKVKVLIKQFNEGHNKDEFLLRKKTKNSLQRSETISGVQRPFSLKTIKDSDELTELLEELRHVTNAPILTPGATSSLTTPVVSDSEWKDIIPTRYRRLSDPDYDIPRPHSSLKLQNRIKLVPKNAIPATRFFGPVLTSQDNISVEPQSLSSMDPDSLEVDQSSNNIKHIKLLELFNKNIDKTDSICSYKSHKYTKVDDQIYIRPKSLLLNTEVPSHKEQKEGNDKSATINSRTEEVFTDSLELSSQSTHF